MAQKEAKNKNNVMRLDQKNDHLGKETNPPSFLKKEYGLTDQTYQSNTRMCKR